MVPSGKEKRPNIIMIVADDHRLSSIGEYGNKQVITPVLDSMMREGMAFYRAYTMGGTSAAVCVPSRAALHSGVSWFNASSDCDSANVYEMMTINPERETLGAVLQNAGYRTFATGKWHNDKESFHKSFSDGAKIFFGGDGDPMRLPVHDFDPSGSYGDSDHYIDGRFSTDLFADAAIDYLRSCSSSDTPFFLYTAFTSPHDPRTAPEPYASVYRPGDIVLTDNVLPAHPFDNGEMEIRDERLEAWPRSPDLIRKHIADYYGMISHMDARIGDMLQAVRDAGADNNTIIIFTSDHGLALGQHGLMGKQNLYEHSVRVPLILYGTNIPAGRRVEALAQQYDIFPTICDLAHAPFPEDLDGISLLPLIRGKASSIRNEAGAVYRYYQRMVCDERWKLIRYYRPPGGSAGTDCMQLFDLANDPLETCNLASFTEYGNQLETMLDKLEAWMLRNGDPLAGKV